MSGRLIRRGLVGAAAAFGVAVLANVSVFVAVLSRDPLPATGAPHAGDALRDLPLLERPPTTPSASAPLVVYFTGDHGWRDGDLAFTQGLGRYGAPVVVIDSLHYFAWGRSEAEATAALSRVIDRYSQVWGPRDVVLAGYSFGAEVLPLLAQRLPPAQRARIRLVAMIAPVDRFELAIRPWSLLDFTDDPFAFSVRKEVQTLGGLRAVCIWAADDHRAACPGLTPTAVRLVRVPGGHRFLGQREAVAAAIAQAADMRP